MGDEYKNRLARVDFFYVTHYDVALGGHFSHQPSPTTMGLANDTLDLMGFCSGTAAVLCMASAVYKRFPQLGTQLSKLFEQVSKKSVK